MTTDKTTIALLTHASRRLEAIASIVDGRLAEAERLVVQLQKDPAPITPGVCQFCGCTEHEPCGVYAPIGPDSELVAVTCAWVDASETVCSAVRCIHRWQTLQTSAAATLITP